MGACAAWPKNLRRLRLQNVRLDDVVRQCAAVLPQLEDLSVEDVRDASIPALESMSHLKSLRLTVRNKFRVGEGSIGPCAFNWAGSTSLRDLCMDFAFDGDARTDLAKSVLHFVGNHFTTSTNMLRHLELLHVRVFYAHLVCCVSNFTEVDCLFFDS